MYSVYIYLYIMFSNLHCVVSNMYTLHITYYITLHIAIHYFSVKDNISLTEEFFQISFSCTHFWWVSHMCCFYVILYNYNMLSTILIGAVLAYQFTKRIILLCKRYFTTKLVLVNYIPGFIHVKNKVCNPGY